MARTSPGTRRRPRSRTALIAGAVVVLLALAGCAAGPNPALDTGPDPAGFWLGLWQGFILPVTFVVSLFTDDVSIYEVQNSGGWYDFGYVLGLVAVLGGGGGGGSAAARR
jgi:hypothetical protein